MNSTLIIDQTADALRSMGVLPGQSIAILSENSFKYAILIAACWKAGAVVIPLSIRYPDEMIALALESVNCNMLVVSEKHSRVKTNIKKS